MEEKRPPNKGKATWDDFGGSTQQIRVKDVQRKVTPQAPKSHSKMLEYEQISRANKKRAKEIKRRKKERQGLNQSPSDDDDGSDKQLKQTSNNFKRAPLSKATKKKRKRQAKKAQKQPKKRKKSSSDSDSGSDSESSSSEDNTPSVRYGANMRSAAGRSKFGGIQSMKQRKQKQQHQTKKIASKPKKMAPKAKEISSSEPEQTPTPPVIIKDDSVHLDVELEFKRVEVEYMQLLDAPEGVLCGGETVMYYRNARDGGEYFYLATDDDEDIIGILEYDVGDAKWNKFVDYPDDFLPDLHGNCVDIAKRKLYVFDRQQFGILDLNTKEWDIRSANRDRNYSDTVSKIQFDYNPHPTNNSDSLNNIKSPRMFASGGLSIDGTHLELLGIQSVYLESPIEEIHVFGRTKIPPGSYHLILDEQAKYLKLGGFDSDELMRGHKLVYADGCRKLIVCGGQKQDIFDGNWIDSNSIWLCDISNKLQVNGYNWRELQCKLPYGGKTFGVVTAYGSILVVIYLRDNENKEIYCLDLLDREGNYKFIKSEMEFPFEGDCEYTDVIKTDQDMVHCMYFSLYGHCKLSLYQIVPIELKERYRSRFEMSVNGYVRDNMRHKIPQTAINGIAKYLSELC